MRRSKLERAALRVARSLGEGNCLLVGGLAVAAHGYVRATTDVDFVTRLPLAEASALLKGHGIAAELRRGDVLEGDFPCILATVDGARVDVMPPLVALDWERAIEIPLDRGARLLVVDLAGLIRLKLRAGGPKDLMDVAALVLQHPEHLGRARELATAYRAADRLETWLKDPRMKREALQGAPPKPVRRGARGRRPV
ncbi:MAG TPA: hypothetical protein VFM88_01160 [Vicinamibacteria bacterium]|nr:hypothetical protein [Vicinamibacteria bacterium]